MTKLTSDGLRKSDAPDAFMAMLIASSGASDALC